MLRLFAIDERGQSYPLIAVATFLIAVLVSLAMGFAWLALRRSQLQAAADAAALAGANALAKTEMTISALDLSQFTVHLASDLLITMGAIGTYAGVGAPLLEKGLALKLYAEERLDPAIERAKDFARMAGPVYAVIEAVAYAEANGCGGIGIPWPIEGLGQLLVGAKTGKPSDYGQKMKRLITKLEEYQRRIKESDEAMARLKAVSPDHYMEIDADADGKSDFEQAAGAKGGCTTMMRQVERDIRELARKERAAREEEKRLLAKLPKLSAGRRGILVVVWRQSEEVPFVSFLGGQATGRNFAFAAAKTFEGGGTLGGGALAALSAKSSAFAGMPAALATNYTDAVGWLYKVEHSSGYGAIAGRALELLGVDPPNVFERKPVLASSREVLGADIDIVPILPSVVRQINAAIKKVSPGNEIALPLAG